MRCWLDAYGFRDKRAKGIPAKAEKQAAFVATSQKLRYHIPKDAPILCMDSVHPTKASKLGDGWLGRRAAQIISTTASRILLNSLETI